MKTIFFIITRGFLARNILRSGILERLKKANIRVVIFFPLYQGNSEISKELQQEFASEHVILEGVIDTKTGLFYRKIFLPVISYLVYTKTTWTYSLMGNNKNKKRSNFFAYLERFTLGWLGQAVWLRSFARWIDQKFFTYNFYQNYFDTYKPDVVFSSSIISKVDIFFMKEARQRGIKTVSMPKGWDNIAKHFYHFIPDLLFVQNKVMKDQAVIVQNIPKEQVQVVGFPQFDYYYDKSFLMTREEYCRSLGINPAKKIIFFGSEGIWAPNDDDIARSLSFFIKENKLFTPSSLIIRPHYTDVKSNRFSSFVTPDVVLDPHYTLSNFFMDNWNPTKEDMRWFWNLLYHSDLLVTTTSTLTLDAACFDKPIINVAFGILFKRGKDMSELFYNKDHYLWVLETNAVDVVRNEQELLQSIDKYLKDPSLKKQERQVLRDKLCNFDGKASEHIVTTLLNFI